jgi:hypothetical protein
VMGGDVAKVGVVVVVVVDVVIEVVWRSCEGRRISDKVEWRSCESRWDS